MSNRMSTCTCTAPRCDAHGEHAPCSVCRELAMTCKHCGRTVSDLGLGAWQHCPEHDGGALLHEFREQSPAVPLFVERHQ